jgi:hypothetical protein
MSEKQCREEIKKRNSDLAHLTHAPWRLTPLPRTIAENLPGEPSNRAERRALAKYRKREQARKSQRRNNRSEGKS